MPPVFIWLAGAIGAAVVARFLLKEAHRINTELDAVKARSKAEAPTSRLVRDPVTGHFRPERRA
jgi:hypothetical protein